MSVLTEEKYFAGSMDFLSRAAKATRNSLPILRKDFIFDLLQVEATAATAAAAILLIVRLTPDVKTLRNLRERAEDFGLASVVEVFDKDDLHMARESGATIIQVNARDLKTFRVNREDCLNLPRQVPPLPGEIWIAASGIENNAHLCEARDAGFTAALVGTALMRGGRPGLALKQLLKGNGRTESAC